MRQIYFVRHGETEWNALGKFQGMTDVPLSAHGRTQAEACAKRLSDIRFDAIIASDLSRALETAKTINKYHQLPIEPDPRLREINFGDWETLTYEEIEARWANEIHQLYSCPGDLKIPKGESFLDVQERSLVALLEAVDTLPPNGRLLVVCHGGTIRTLLCALLHIPLNCAWNLGQGNTAISIVNYIGTAAHDYNVLQLLNDVGHLKELTHAPR